MGNRLTKKLLAMLLAVCMIAALMPVSVFAEGAAEKEDFIFLPEGVTEEGTSGYNHAYHTNLKVVANVTVKTASGKIKETSEITKETGFIEGNLSGSLINEDLPRMKKEIADSLTDKGTVTEADYYNRAGMTFDHFESMNIYTFVPEGGEAVELGNIDNVREYFKERPDAKGILKKILDVHEYQIYTVEYDVTVQTPVITDVEIINVNTDLNPNKPVSFTAKAGQSCEGLFDIKEEMWEKSTAGEETPVKDIIRNTEAAHNPVTGGNYYYSIVLTAKDGYTFSNDFSGENYNIKDGGEATFTLNGVSYTNCIALSDDGKTLTAWEFMEPVTAISKPSGGGYYRPVQKPEIITGEGGKTALENSGGTLVITPDDGMQISKVTVNGNEVTITDNKVTGLKTGDKVEVTFAKIPPTKEELDKEFKEKAGEIELVVRTSKTSKNNIKVTVKLTPALEAFIKEIKSAGYTVKYKFYRSANKSSKYAARITKEEAEYLNTEGKKDKKYYYKAKLLIYDNEGNLVAQTELKQCKYGVRTWSK